MKMKKILASVAAAALAVSTLAISAFAAEPVTVKLDDGYMGDWAQAGIIKKENFDKFEGDVKVVLTVEATNVADGNAYLLKPMEADKGWDAVTSQLTTSKESAKPDGFIAIHYDQTEVEFVVPSAMRADMWDGGISFQVNNVIIKSAVLSDGAAESAFGVVEEADTANYCAASAASESSDSEEAAGAPFDKTYKATMSFADTAWGSQDWESTVDVPGYGTYSLKANVESFADFGVFCIDIPELGTYLGVQPGSGEYDMSKCTVSDLKVIVDGSEIAVDLSKVLWGDPEEKGNLRIEIYNQYGKTKDASPIDNTISGSSLEVQFTLAEVSGEAASEAETTTEAPAETTAAPADTAGFDIDFEPVTDDTSAAESEAVPADTADVTTETVTAPAGDTNAPAADKGNADTGVEGVAVVAALAVLAGGAVVIAKKRK